MKVKLHQHTGETKWKIEKFPRQTLWLAAALQACHIPAIYIPATWFFILHTPVWWHFLWITPASLLGSGEELLGFILLVRRHHRDANYNTRSFWNPDVDSPGKGRYRERPWAQGSHEVARWAFTAAPRSSRSKLFEKSRQIFSGVM